MQIATAIVLSTYRSWVISLVSRARVALEIISIQWLSHEYSAQIELAMCHSLLFNKYELATDERQSVRTVQVNYSTLES